jgi:mRNA-degrading endonuclease RelE of RelBE toxin-antitoxin system
MKSFTVKSYWDAYKDLLPDIRKQADSKFELWKEDPFHPSLHFKCVNSEDNIWSVRVDLDYRALAVKEKDTVIWYWIGDHDKYKKLLKSL